MSFYETRVLPYLIEVALAGKAFDRVRGRVTEGLSGQVVEIGFGSGRSAPHYPESIQRVQAVDPSLTARRMAAKRLARTSVPVEFVGLDGERLPIDEESVDHVLITWTLCTIPHPDRALAEMHRVLRPGGSVHFVEHGRSPDAGVARWQDRLTPFQMRVAGGCHLNRPIADLIQTAGFGLDKIETYYLGPPKLFTYTYEGVATKP